MRDFDSPVLIYMAQLQEYKCPCCGGAVEFDTKSQRMRCPYCETEFDVAALGAMREDSAADNPDSISWDTNAGTEWTNGEGEGMRVYTCNSCGGEIVVDINTAATSCPFCGNPVTMTGNLTGTLKPDLVIPFKLDKEAAKSALLRHYEGKRLLPKFFRSDNHINEIKGVYVPFWLFDGDAEADIRYKATRVRTWSDSKYNYTETSYFSVFRSGELMFDHVPVDGSTKMPDDLMESIEPYNMDEAVDFRTAYLSGFLADKYDVSAQDSVERANERIKESTARAFRDTVDGYVTVTPEASSIRIENGRAKYALLPIWLLNTTWEGKKYTFAMNGQTGKFVGNLPYDKKQYWKWWAIYAAIAGAAAFLVLTMIFA